MHVSFEVPVIICHKHNYFGHGPGFQKYKSFQKPNPEEMVTTGLHNTWTYCFLFV